MAIEWEYAPQGSERGWFWPERPRRGTLSIMCSVGSVCFSSEIPGTWTAFPLLPRVRSSDALVVAHVPNLRKQK